MAASLVSTLSYRHHSFAALVFGLSDKGEKLKIAASLLISIYSEGRCSTASSAVAYTRTRVLCSPIITHRRNTPAAPVGIFSTNGAKLALLSLLVLVARKRKTS